MRYLQCTGMFGLIFKANSAFLGWFFFVLLRMCLRATILSQSVDELSCILGSFSLLLEI